MLSQSTFQFLKSLKKNNNKGWFDKNRPAYHEAKIEFETLTGQLISEIAKYDKGLVGLAPKKCTFRIFRDVRFSKNKSPYKTNMGAYMIDGGRKNPKAGYYLHVEPGGSSFIAGGMYMPPAEVLKAVRQEIDYNTKAFKKIINNKTFKETFSDLWDDKLKTAPREYSKDHPEIALLKYKSYIVMHPVKDEQLLSEDFVRYAASIFKKLYPFNAFLNAALS